MLGITERNRVEVSPAGVEGDLPSLSHERDGPDHVVLTALAEHHPEDLSWRLMVTKSGRPVRFLTNGGGRRGAVMQREMTMKPEASPLPDPMSEVERSAQARRASLVVWVSRIVIVAARPVAARRLVPAVDGVRARHWHLDVAFADCRDTTLVMVMGGATTIDIARNQALPPHRSSTPGPIITADIVRGCITGTVRSTSCCRCPSRWPGPSSIIRNPTSAIHTVTIEHTAIGPGSRLSQTQ